MLWMRNKENSFPIHTLIWWLEEDRKLSQHDRKIVDWGARHQRKHLINSINVLVFMLGHAKMLTTSSYRCCKLFGLNSLLII